MTTLPISDPNFTPPRDVERIWAGKDRHYATSTVEPYDRTRALRQLEADGGSASESTLSRAVTAYGPNGRVTPGLIPKWPILKHQERPWVRAAAPVPVVDDLLKHAHAIENVVDDAEDSAQLHRLTRLLELMRNTSTVAAVLVGAFTLLDVISDGKLNSVIVWCHLLPVGSPVSV